MTRILLVEDSPSQAQLILRHLQKGRPEAEIELVANGFEGLARLEAGGVDLVLTDLHMPELDGLGLVKEMSERFPLVPTILMTAHGSEELIVRALHMGAASYVSKDRLMRLAPTIEQVLEIAHAARSLDRVFDALVRTEVLFVLENDVTLISPLVGHCEDELFRRSFCDRPGARQVSMALSEALANAIYHGNLELSSDHKEDGSFHELARQRVRAEPYGSRRVEFSAHVEKSTALFVVRDEGPGFDPSSVPDPTDPDNIERPSGRGLLLIRTFMDEVHHNDLGNEITMVKRARRRVSASGDLPPRAPES